MKTQIKQYEKKTYNFYPIYIFILFIYLISKLSYILNANLILTVPFSFYANN